MLKEGWDVTNLYTIVPLRAANSRTLVEQSVGRGLRLPYGRRTGVSAVDTLNIVSHDHFQEIVEEARRPDSVIRRGIVIGRDISLNRVQVTEVEPRGLQNLAIPAGAHTDVQAPLFSSPRGQAVARKTLEVLHTQFAKLPTLSKLASPEVAARVAELVKEQLVPDQASLESEPVDVDAIVATVIERFPDLIIAIPRIVVVPKGAYKGLFQPFRLDLRGLRPQPVDDKILLQFLRTERQERLSRGESIADETRLEDYVVRGLIDFDDVCYDDHADVLYDLAGQVVRHVASYITDEQDQRGALRYHQRALVSEVHEQMLDHYVETGGEYEVEVTRDFVQLPKATLSSTENDPRDFRASLEQRALIRQLIFAGFEKSLYPLEKFDSDPERRFAVVLENDKAVRKWLRPRRGVISIYYQQDDEYVPDFVVETEDRKYLCEIKDEEALEDAEVEAKATAAVLWCERASEHSLSCGEKPWSYLLIPGSTVAENKTLKGLAELFTRKQ